MQAAPTLQNTLTAADAKARWDDLLAGTARGEEWFITNAEGQAFAKLAPVSADLAEAAESDPIKTAHAYLHGMMEGHIELLPGWDDPLEEFASYS